jgi:hypothetical protein
MGGSRHRVNRMTIAGEQLNVSYRANRMTIAGEQLNVC